MYKPGNLSAPPAVVTPHQPRLDWQMWFAALGDQTQAPWFTSLMYRLLQGKRDGMLLFSVSYHSLISLKGNTTDWVMGKKQHGWLGFFWVKS